MADNSDCDDGDPETFPGAGGACSDHDCGVPAGGGHRLDVPGALPTIGSAIATAVDGDIVCVGPGTYDERIDFAGKAIEVVGYDGPADTILDARGSASVVTFSNFENRQATLDGFTVTGGSSVRGAGIYVYQASPTLRNLVVSGNTGACDNDGTWGAGIYLESSYASLSDLEVSDNVQDCHESWGAGVAVTYEYYGPDGGLSDIEMTNVRIEGNRQSCETPGGFYGAGLLVRFSFVSLHDVYIDDNLQIGGGWGAGVLGYYYGDVAWTGGTLSGNAIEGAGTGGGIATGYWSSALLSGVAIIGNSVSGPSAWGGGASAGSCEAGDITLQNLLVAGNSVRGESTGGGGGLAVYMEGSLDLVNVDVVGNLAEAPNANGGGIGFFDDWGILDVINSDIAFNAVSGEGATGSAIFREDIHGNSVQIRYSNLHGDDDLLPGGDPLAIGEGMVSADPLFVDISSADPFDWDLHLQPGSPLIDAGDPDIQDVDGTRSDIGGYGGPLGGW